MWMQIRGVLAILSIAYIGRRCRLAQIQRRVCPDFLIPRKDGIFCSGVNVIGRRERKEQSQIGGHLWVLHVDSGKGERK